MMSPNSALLTDAYETGFWARILIKRSPAKAHPS
jgi:hypothetical protein